MALVSFKPCPDCGSEEYPDFDRSSISYNVRAICPKCGFSTKYFETVAYCAEEWNETIFEDRYHG